MLSKKKKKKKKKKRAGGGGLLCSGLFLFLKFHIIVAFYHNRFHIIFDFLELTMLSDVK